MISRYLRVSEVPGRIITDNNSSLNFLWRKSSDNFECLSRIRHKQSESWRVAISLHQKLAMRIFGRTHWHVMWLCFFFVFGISIPQQKQSGTKTRRAKEGPNMSTGGRSKVYMWLWWCCHSTHWAKIDLTKYRCSIHPSTVLTPVLTSLKFDQVSSSEVSR